MAYEGDKLRCPAIKQNGERCRNWYWRWIDRPNPKGCHLHGVVAPPSAEKGDG